MALNSHLPEIRERDAFSGLTDYAFKNHITKAYADLYFISIKMKFRFLSDKKDSSNNHYFKDIYYGSRHNRAFNKAS